MSNSEFDNIMKRLEEETDIRIMSLNKYKPFFEISDSMGRGQKYKQLDFEVVLISLLSYVFYEGKLKGVEIYYADIKSFLKNLLERTQMIESVDDEYINLLSEGLIDKLTEVRFCDHYSMKTHKNYNQASNTGVRYINSKLAPDRRSIYELSEYAIDFLLNSKEFEEESKITIHLLLLKKRIDNKEYNVALASLTNVLAEVRRQIERIHHIQNKVLYGGEPGYLEYKEYKSSVYKRFDEERVLFSETVCEISTLRDEYIEKVALAELSEKEIKSLNFLDKMEIELKKIVEIHQRLLAEVVILDSKVDLIQKNKMKNSLKSNFVFNEYLDKMINIDNSLALEKAMEPFVAKDTLKIFSFEKIDDMLICPSKSQNLVNNELLEEEEIEIEHLNKKICKRIICNYTNFLLEVYRYMQKVDSEKITLKEFVFGISEEAREQIVKNPDFVSFVIELQNIEHRALVLAERGKGKRIDNINEKDSEFDKEMDGKIRNALNVAYRNFAAYIDKDLIEIKKLRSAPLKDKVFVDFGNGIGMTDLVLFI